MAEDLVVNDVTYPEVEAIETINRNGERVAFYPDAVRYVEQTLTEEQKEQAKENIGVPKMVLIPVFIDGEGKPSSVYSFDAIYDLIVRGCTVYVHFEDTILPLLTAQVDIIEFGVTLAAGDAFITFLVSFDRSGYVNFDALETASLPNPNPLTINGTSYDGSEPVEVNIPKGAAGQRGTGLLAVTTGPASYTTAVGGITPKYRMEISTIKTQAGVTDVLLGDTVRYSYYHYPIAYLDASYAYFTTRVSIRGATGSAGAAGTTPVKGTDYWTEADKTEIVNDVLAALPMWTGGAY